MADLKVIAIPAEDRAFGGADLGNEHDRIRQQATAADYLYVEICSGWRELINRIRAELAPSYFARHPGDRRARPAGEVKRNRRQ